MADMGCNLKKKDKVFDVRRKPLISTTFFLKLNVLYSEDCATLRSEPKEDNYFRAMSASPPASTSTNRASRSKDLTIPSEYVIRR